MVGIVRIGITDGQAKAALALIVRNVLLLTIFIITTGILIIYLLTSRITTPLRSLAAATVNLQRVKTPQACLFLHTMMKSDSSPMHLM